MEKAKIQRRRVRRHPSGVQLCVSALGPKCREIYREHLLYPRKYARSSEKFLRGRQPICVKMDPPTLLIVSPEPQLRAELQDSRGAGGGEGGADRRGG